HPHLPRAVRQYFVAVLELDAEHGVRQRLDDGSLQHDGVFLGLGQVILLETLLSCSTHPLGQRAAPIDELSLPCTAVGRAPEERYREREQHAITHRWRAEGLV